MEHEHSEEKSERLLTVCSAAVGALLIIISFFVSPSAAKLLLIAATVVGGLPTLNEAYEKLKEKEFDESGLLIIAAAAATFIGENLEAAAVTVLFCIGELLEGLAEDRSRHSIEALFGIIGEKANKVNDDGTLVKIEAEDIRCGMKLAVLPHERIPADGTVYAGHGDINTSALTGESIPVEAEPGTKLLGGYMNGNSTLYYIAEADRNDSAAARIAAMVNEAAEKKGKAQSIVAKFAKIYTPAVVILAVLAAVIPSLLGGDIIENIRRALIILVASCPCAVVISAPLAFFSSMGACARNGIIIKGSRYIEALAAADTAVFDKTGTLTTGELRVAEIIAAEGYSEKEVLRIAAECEYYSTHPIARAISAAAGEIDASKLGEMKEIPGGGTCVKAPEGVIICGSARLMTSAKADISALPDAQVYVTLNKKAIGCIRLEGDIRKGMPEAIVSLRKLGIKKILMLTGDGKNQASAVCTECGLDGYVSELLPGGKLSELEKIKKNSSGVIYVGDGINDAPVLALADAGCAMGIETKAASEAADIIITNAEPSKLADAVYQSRRTVKILKINIAFAIAVKLLIIILGILGIAPMWSAVLADVGTMIICIIISSGLFKVKRFNK